MRPESLYPLFAPLSALTGLGPRLAPMVEKIAGPHVVDLLWHLPYALIDRRFMPKIADAPPGRMATIRLRVDQHVPAAAPRRPYRVLCSDDSGTLTLVFFHAKTDWLEKLLPVGAERIVSGMVEAFNDSLQMTHPDHVVAPDRQGEVMTIEPVYRLTAGLPPKVMVKAVQAAVERAPPLVEWIDAAYLRRQDWPSWREALHRVHAPGGEADLSPMAPVRQRLAYDELLANQLALSLVRASLRRSGRTFGRRRRTAARTDHRRPALPARPVPRNDR